MDTRRVSVPQPAIISGCYRGGFKAPALDSVKPEPLLHFPIDSDSRSVSSLPMPLQGVATGQERYVFSYGSAK